MLKDVTDVEVVAEYRLVLAFEGGERREIDLADLLSFKGIFEPLRDGAFFRRVHVNPDVGTIVWPNGADVCPDVLYAKSRPLVQADSC